jgi:hypothetical protein
MNAIEVLDRLRSDASLPQVFLAAGTNPGPESYSFFVSGEQSRFSSISEFVAAALSSIAAELSHEVADLEGLEVIELKHEAWQIAYDYTIRPGSMLCFPTVEKLGFEPPQNLQKRFSLQPNLIDIEECMVCEAKGQFVLLYWQTAG